MLGSTNGPHEVGSSSVPISHAQRENTTPQDIAIRKITAQIMNLVRRPHEGGLSQSQILILKTQLASLQTSVKALPDIEAHHEKMKQAISSAVESQKQATTPEALLNAQKKIYLYDFKRRIAEENLTSKQSELQTKIDTLAKQVSQMQELSDNRLLLSASVRTQIRRTERAAKKTNTDKLNEKIGELKKIQENLENLSIADDPAFLQQQKEELKTLTKEISKIKRNLAKEEPKPILRERVQQVEIAILQPTKQKENYDQFLIYMNELLKTDVSKEFPSTIMFRMVHANQNYKEGTNLSEKEKLKFADFETLKRDFPDSFEKYYDHYLFGSL